MDYSLMIQFCEEITPMIQTRYRYLNRRWWMIKDGYWTQNLAREFLIQDINALAAATQLPGQLGLAIRANVPKNHVTNQVISRLGAVLYAYQGLPAPDTRQ